MPESVAATSSTNESLALLWLALSLTEGLGPNEARVWLSIWEVFRMCSRHRSPNWKPPAFGRSRRNPWQSASLRI